MISQNEFLKKYNIKSEEFSETGIIWKDLENIYHDYKSMIPELESTAEFIFNNLRKLDKVHSVKFRVKDPEHLIEKIIRKKKSDNNSDINLDNYKTELTDLIGLRVLHLFKVDFEVIHEYISNTWDLNSTATANHREGDDPETLDRFQKLGFNLKVHPAGYRSLHYIVKTTPTKITFFAEIQVRTIYEEAWSEIDHTIRYPYNTDNNLINQFLMILNRLSGNADEMGTFVSLLNDELASLILEREEKNKEYEKVISNLKNDIETISNKNEKEKILKTFETLKNKRSDIISTSELLNDRIPSFMPKYITTEDIIPNYDKLLSISNSKFFKNIIKDDK